MTKRTVLLLALAATTGIPAMAACSTAERQAPLPPQAAGPNSLPSSTQGGTSIPLTAGGGAAPSSGTVGANVTPGSADPSGGLRTRPGHAAGPAGSATAIPDGYRIGARAPWGILLDDRPEPAPLPVPAPGPHETGDGRSHGQPAQPEAPSGDGVVILAEGARPNLTVKLPSVALPPGQAKKIGGDAVATGDSHGSDAADSTEGPDAFPAAGLPSSISFSSLLSVLPSVASVPTSQPATNDEKPGKAPKTKDGQTPGAKGESDPDGTPGTSTNGPEQTARPLPLPTHRGTVLHPSPAPTRTPNRTPTPTPTRASSPAPQPAAPAPAPTPAASGWHLDGLSLQSPSPAATGKDGSPAFRKALRAALAARPDGKRPGPAALRRWSTALQKAATLAPDARTKAQLRTLARYAHELAATPGPKRSALQAKRPGALHAASALRASLPRRFGVDLLG